MLLKTFESRRSGWELYPTRWGVLITLVLACTVGCGPEASFPEELEQLGSTTQAKSLIVDNGLNLNGLNLNGLNLNGLNLNGLNLNGLSTSAFSNWFQADRTLRNEVMKYVVACAVPSGQSRTYTDPGTSTTYTWQGVLGLAPSWASGNAATTVEHQVVSACMAAHTNKFGIHVNISLLGLDGAGNTIPYTSQELTDYATREACFFGNLFDGSTGTFGGNDGISLASNESTARVCGIAGTGVNVSQCSPMVYAGSCSTYCTRDATNTFYTSCTYNGVTYRPITTRMRTQDIHRCGDGVCQATESSGTCAADC
jgi:hypothetical protein